MGGSWRVREEMAIAPLARLAKEIAPRSDPAPGNIIPVNGRMAA
jgi:hypothetical protein